MKFIGVAFVVLVFESANGASLYNSRSSSAFLAPGGESTTAIPGNKAIKEKWDKMDEFLEVMFGIACQWSHGKDVDGRTSEALKKGDLDAEEAMKFKKDLQQENIQGFKDACGLIVAESSKKCRQGCASRWGEAMEQRNTCDGKCETVYSQFETRCLGKVDDLSKVYSMKVSAETSRNTCYKGHCSEFPTVWTKASVEEMQSEVTTRCDERCTPEKIEMRCQLKWQLEVDFVRAAAKSKCAASDSSTACFETQKSLLSSEFDTCKSTATSTCDTQLTDCKTKGNTDATFKESAEFCGERHKMCLEQVNTNCLAEHEAGLKKAQDSCQAAAKTGSESCESQAVGTAETQSKSQCETGLAPKCDKDCAAKCDSTKLHSCLEGLKSETDPAEMFCTDVWQLLHATSATDPVTGDPLVF